MWTIQLISYPPQFDFTTDFNTNLPHQLFLKMLIFNLMLISEQMVVTGYHSTILQCHISFERSLIALVQIFVIYLNEFSQTTACISYTLFWANVTCQNGNFSRSFSLTHRHRTHLHSIYFTVEGNN